MIPGPEEAQYAKFDIAVILADPSPALLQLILFAVVDNNGRKDELKLIVIPDVSKIHEFVSVTI